MSETQNINKVVLAYSGGLDTSVMLHWIKETYDCEVVCFCADVGQDEELDGLEEKALATGASKIYIDDLTEEFASDFVFPAVQANAVYEGTYLMGTSLARPLISKRHIEIAKLEGADAVAHGATGKGNDQIRFELGYYALKPDIKVIAPWREWPFRSRTDLIEYAAANKIPITVSAKKPYSMDRNLMHISYEGGILEDPWAEPPEDIFLLTQSPEKAPDQAQYVEVDFENGIPTRVDGEGLSPATLVRHLNKIAGTHGVGRVDIVENRFVGMKSRGVYETPGVTILHHAHRALESLTMDREVMHLRDSLNTRLSDMMYNGFWFSPEMELMKAMINESQKNVTGTVRLKLYKGNCTVVGRKSPFSLYSEEHATFEEDDVYDQRDAEGFIKLNALRLRLGAQQS
jgi:argininosuccinate synthase